MLNFSLSRIDEIKGIHKVLEVIFKTKGGLPNVYAKDVSVGKSRMMQGRQHQGDRVWAWHLPPHFFEA